METIIRQLFDAFQSTEILIVGDLMADKYYWGKVDRISPEAPVPVVSVRKKEIRLGGAANVALNCVALGATTHLCAVAGEDANGEALHQLLLDNNIKTEGIVLSKHKPTTTKARIISSGQQMLRIDEEDASDLTAADETELLSRVRLILDKYPIKAIILEDYNKGVLTENVITQIVTWANEKGIITTVDPKKKNFLSYKNVTLFKPNLKELKEGLNVEIGTDLLSQLNQAEQLLRKELNAKLCFITLSEHGVYVSDGVKSNIHSAHKRVIADVSGAGDTVISVASLCLANNASPDLMAQLANLAGGLVCEQVGVVPIDSNLLLAEAIKLKA